MVTLRMKQMKQATQYGVLSLRMREKICTIHTTPPPPPAAVSLPTCP